MVYGLEISFHCSIFARQPMSFHISGRRRIHALQFTLLTSYRTSFGSISTGIRKFFTHCHLVSYQCSFVISNDMLEMGNVCPTEIYCQSPSWTLFALCLLIMLQCRPPPSSSGLHLSPLQEKILKWKMSTRISWSNWKMPLLMRIHSTLHLIIYWKKLPKYYP